MNIFEKRPLCLILCIGLGGFLLFTFDKPVIRLVIILAAILLGIISIFFKKFKAKRILCLASSAAILLGCLLSFLYFDLSFKAYEIYDGEARLVGTVEEVSESSSYSLRLLVRVEKINGKSRSYRFYAYPTKADAKGVCEGARISFKATLDGFSDESYAYNISKGINAYASDIEELSIIEYTKGTLRTRFGRIREYMTRYIIICPTLIPVPYSPPCCSASVIICPISCVLISSESVYRIFSPLAVCILQYCRWVSVKRSRL